MKKLFGFVFALGITSGVSQVDARYLEADPFGLVDGPSIYGYAAQNPQRYTDPTGEFIPILIGIAIGLAIDAGVSYIEENCSCADPSMPSIPYAYPAIGGAYGATGPFVRKPRTGVAGGGRSGSRTSVVSTRFGSSTTPGGRAARTAGRRAAKFLPYAGAATALYDGYRLRGCITQYFNE